MLKEHTKSIHSLVYSDAHTSRRHVRKKPTFMTKEQKMEMYRDHTVGGMTYVKCAELYGIHPNSVTRIFRAIRAKAAEPIERYEGGRKINKYRAKNKKMAPCGTNAAYMRHCKLKEVPCQKCCDAHAATLKAYRRKKAA